MEKYIIKNNLPEDLHKGSWVYPNEKIAKLDFRKYIDDLSAKYPTKVVFRNKPLRGTIQVEIDGFFYYVELYKEG